MPEAIRRDKSIGMRLPPLSFEAAFGLFVALVVGVVEMNWELRSLGVLFAAGLAVHIAKQLDAGLARKIGFAVIAIGVLFVGTYHPIWVSFHEDFPAVTAETVLSRIIMFCGLAASGVAGYIFLIRPRGKEGYRVLPAQVMAFGACVIGAGFATVLIGLVWQFQQDWAAGTKPTGAPVFSVVPPQITQTPSPLALPAPQPATPTPFFSDYNLTDAGVTVLAQELYKSRDVLGRIVELNRMATDGTASGFLSNFGRACDQAGVDCPVNMAHPNSPDEKGLLIYVLDANNPPDAAKELKSILLKLGIDVPFMPRPGFSPPYFTLFVGPKP